MSTGQDILHLDLTAWQEWVSWAEETARARQLKWVCAVHSGTSRSALPELRGKGRDGGAARQEVVGCTVKGLRHPRSCDLILLLILPSTLATP